MEVLDRAGIEYWNSQWKQTPSLPKALELENSSIRYFPFKKISSFFDQYFKGIKSESEVLEVGCARSRWMQAISKRYSVRISGIDLSNEGLKQTDAMLKRDNIDADLYQVDFFNPPEHLYGRFNYLYSFGVIEHFLPQEEVLRSFSRFLKFEGLIITFIPNIPGIVGTLTKFFNRAVYDIHYPIDKKQLATAHQKAGFDLVFCDYLIFWNSNAANLEPLKEKFLGKIFIKFLSFLDLFFWSLESKFKLPLRPNFLTSPYIVCVAKKNF